MLSLLAHREEGFGKRRISFDRRMGYRTMRLSCLIALVALLTLTAGGCTRRNTTSQSSGERPASTATLRIDAPQIGQEIPAGLPFRIKLVLTGARIVEQTTTRVTPDTGHVHLMLDGQLVSMTSSLDHEIIVPPGSHVLEAEFVAADHFPFNPRIIAVAAFKAK